MGKSDSIYTIWTYSTSIRSITPRSENHLYKLLPHNPPNPTITHCNLLRGMVLRIASNRLIKILAKEYKAAVSCWICFLKTKAKLHCQLRNALKTMLIVFPFQALIFLAFCKIQNLITKGSRYKERATTFFTLKTCVECFSCLMGAFINVISRGATP